MKCIVFNFNIFDSLKAQEFFQNLFEHRVTVIIYSTERILLQKGENASRIKKSLLKNMFNNTIALMHNRP